MPKRKRRRSKRGRRREVVYTIGGQRVGDAVAFVDAIEGGIDAGVEAWLEDIRIELNQNTGAIWPYDTGASSQGFEVVQVADGRWTWENVEDYAVILEARGGYLVQLMDERDAQLEAAMDEAVGRL